MCDVTMNTQHLLLLERSVDLMILGRFLDVFLPPHAVAANRMKDICKEIFKEIKTGPVVWKVEHKSVLTWFETILVIKKNDQSARIAVSGMNNAENPTINFNGALFCNNDKGQNFIRWHDFNNLSESEQMKYFKEKLGL